MKNILLYSGGPDSFIALRRLWSLGNLTTLYFDLGVRYGAQEKYAITQTAPQTIIDTSLKSLGSTEREDAYVPYRNAHFILGAAKCLEEREKACIYLVVQKDEMALADRSERFLLDISCLLRGMGLNVDVQTPFRGMDKTAMVGMYLHEGGDPADLKRTWSCYRPYPTCDEQQREISDYVGCGDCPACIRRFIAFSVNGVNEEYGTDPIASETASAYRLRAKKKQYSDQRCQRILEALGEDEPDRTRYKGADRALR